MERKFLQILISISQHLLLKKLYSIQTNLQSVKMTLKRRLLYLLEIDGEEKNQMNSQNTKLRLKISLFKVLQAVGNLKQLEDQLNLQMLHFQEFRLLNIPKQAMQAKTQALLFKITKIAINNFKAKYDTFNRKIVDQVWDEVYLQILDSMLGSNWSDETVWKKKLEDLKKGYYNDQIITIIPSDYKPKLNIQPPYPPQRPITRTVKQVANILYTIYSDKLKSSFPTIDIQKQALKYVEEQGIIFLDEIDKLAVPEGPQLTGKGVSTQGVQRDLLPLLEGTIINTKFGDIKTDHILFIASGSFSMAKVQDLIPQLLGRLPIRVQLNPISYQEFIRILKEPKYNLLMQQRQLMKMEDIQLQFTDESIKEIAKYAYEFNMNTQNIGARRLHAVVEKVMEQISYNAPKHKGEKILIDDKYVNEKVKNMENRVSLSKFLI